MHKEAKVAEPLMISKEEVKEVLLGAQSVLLDLKFFDDESYRRYTGRGIEPTLDTLRYLQSIGKKTRIRIVVVPTINDSEEKLALYLEHLREVTCVDRVELLPFHTMGFFKYAELGIENSLANTPPLDAERKRQLQNYVDQKLKDMRGN